jgi:hypothetical protein
MASERKPCRLFHCWQWTEHYAGAFSLVSRCRRCGLYRIENLLTERAQYGWKDADS